MSETTISISIPTILRDRFCHLFDEDPLFQNESSETARGVPLTTYTIFDTGTDLEIEAVLIEEKVPYTIRVHPGFDVDGSTEHFRILEDGTPVSTSYDDSLNARMVTLEELSDAHAQGPEAVARLIAAKEDEFPVLAWDKQMAILNKESA